MICESCSKLAILEANNKKCRNCKSDVLDNLSIICSACSKRDLVCSICLKKIYLINKAKRNISFRSGGCSSCGGK